MRGTFTQGLSQGHTKLDSDFFQYYIEFSKIRFSKTKFLNEQVLTVVQIQWGNLLLKNGFWSQITHLKKIPKPNMGLVWSTSKKGPALKRRGHPWCPSVFICSFEVRKVLGIELFTQLEKYLKHFADLHGQAILPQFHRWTQSSFSLCIYGSFVIINFNTFQRLCVARHSLTLDIRPRAPAGNQCFETKS